MNLDDLQLLQSMQGYPSVSILLPTHRTSPENKQDPIRLKNLQTEAMNRLTQEFSQYDIAPLLARLDAIIAEIDFRYTLDGLAIFANQDFSRKFDLPFSPAERIVVDETFATRDLVFAMNRTSRYWVLALSEQSTRLFEGTRDTLVEITQGKFPMTHSGPGGAAKLPGGQGINTSEYRDDQHRQFFRNVDAEFSKLTTIDPLPLVLLGVERYLSFYQEETAHNASIISTLKGNYDKTSTHDLGKLIWPEAEKAFDQQRKQVMYELDAAVSAQKYVSSIGEVWRLANEGRGGVLVVEEDFHYPARIDASGIRLDPAEDITAPDVIDDAVDEVIEAVLSKGGRVVFVDPGTLESHQHIALILRY